MKKITVLSILAASLLLACFAPASAQTGYEKYQSETIYLQSGKYVKNGEKYPLGFFSKNLKKELEVSPDAVIEFKKYRKHIKNALIFNLVGAGFAATSTLFKRDDYLGRGGFLVVGVGFVAVGFQQSVKSMNSYQKAIWLRNGEVLK